MTAFDLGDVHHITDRPGATPAPWPVTAGDPPQYPHTPWRPRVVEDQAVEDPFPIRVDKARLGDDYIEVTPETCGAADDPVAQAAYLIGLVEQIKAGMSPQQRRELAQYERPGLRSVA